MTINQAAALLKEMPGSYAFCSDFMYYTYVPGVRSFYGIIRKPMGTLDRISGYAIDSICSYTEKNSDNWRVYDNSGNEITIDVMGENE